MEVHILNQSRDRAVVIIGIGFGKRGSAPFMAGYFNGSWQQEK